MDIKLVAFLFGCLLLAVGILGGGFELKEFSVPKVGWLARFFALLLGGFFIVIGLGLEFDSTSGTGSSPYRSSTGSSSPSSAVSFQVLDHLTPNAVTEKCSVVVDGKEAGTLSADVAFPEQELSVPVAEAGKYDYKIDCAIVFNQQGSPAAYNGMGSGVINIQPNKKFEIIADWNGNAYQLYLKETS